MLRLIMFSATLSGTQMPTTTSRKWMNERDRADGGEAVLRGGLDACRRCAGSAPRSRRSPRTGAWSRSWRCTTTPSPPAVPRRSAGRSRPGSRSVSSPNSSRHRARSLVATDQLPLVVVADLVPEVAQHRAVGLPQLLAHLLAVRRAALGEVDGDHAVGVADRDVLLDAAEQVEGQPVLGVLVLAHDREAQAVELDDQVPLRPLRRREVGQPDGVVVVRPGPGQVAAEALATVDRRRARCSPERVRLRHTNHSWPSASTYRPFSSTGTIARSCAGEPEPGAAGHAAGVLEVERLVADATAEGLHRRSLPRPPNGRITAMTLLDSWALGRALVRRGQPSDVPQGQGPGVIVIHEIPGLTPR